MRYDQTDIHLRYGKSRKLPEETIALWLDTISSHLSRSSIKTIVDLGCGTGRFTKGLSDRFSAKVYGIDPSWKMLTIASQTVSSPRIKYIQGTAESIPVNNSVVDMVFLSMVYHHIQDKSKAISEIARILREDGFLCLRTSTIDSLDSYPYLRFFPGARQLNLASLPSRESITSFLQSSGFKLKGHNIIRQVTAENFIEYFEKISLRGLSDLAAIPDNEFNQGLAYLKEYCFKQETGEAVYEDIDLLVFRKH